MYHSPLGESRKGIFTVLGCETWAFAMVPCVRCLEMGDCKVACVVDVNG